MSNMLPGERNVDSADVPWSSIMDGLRAHKRKMETNQPTNPLAHLSDLTEAIPTFELKSSTKVENPSIGGF